MVPLARKIGPNVAAHSAARWAAFQRKQELLSPAGAAPGGESKGNKRQGPTVAAAARAPVSTESAAFVAADRGLNERRSKRQRLARKK